MLRPRVRGIEWGRTIGAGRRAWVRAARRHGQAVAVKIVPLPTAAARVAFAREVAQSMVPVHANLVQVLHGGVAGRCGYVVMQWVDGLDLELVAGLLRMSGRVIPPRVVAFVVAQVLRGLQWLHRLDGGGQAHGGVRGSHVLLSISGEVRLIGHARSQCCTMADDILEVGLLLHELLVGERTRTPTVAACPSVPRSLDMLRRRMLARDPLERPSAHEALRAIEAWSGHGDRTTELAELMRTLTGVDHPRTVQPFDDDTSTRWSRVVAMAGAAAAIVAGVVAWW
jgi:hypothetical protein